MNKLIEKLAQSAEYAERNGVDFTLHAAAFLDIIAELRAAESKLAKYEEQDPVGKFAFEPLAERYHHIKHGEAKHMEPKLPLVKLFSRPAPAVSMAELVPDVEKWRPVDQVRAQMAYRNLILQKIEELK